MALLERIISYLPEVRGPLQKKLPFSQKLKWTLLILVIFYVLGLIPLFGLGENSLQQFEQLSILLGASFGSILSLGIGPIVTSSIVKFAAKTTRTINKKIIIPVPNSFLIFD